jgi:hypothetical protein
MNSLIAIIILCCSSQSSQLEIAELSCNTAIERGNAFLFSRQTENGGFSLNADPVLHDVWANAESNRSWHIATTSIAAMAWMAQPQDDARDLRIARAVDYLCKSPLVKRPDDWDTDNTWAYVYSLCALTRAGNDPYMEKTNRS